MTEVRIYGHSDDCIEIEGDVREEWYLREGRSFLRFACGTVVRCKFGEGGFGWQFDVVTHGEGVTSELGEPDDMLDMDLKLKGVELPVVHDATEDGPDEDQAREGIEDLDVYGLTEEQALAIYAIVRTS